MKQSWKFLLSSFSLLSSPSRKRMLILDPLLILPSRWVYIITEQKDLACQSESVSWSESGFESGSEPQHIDLMLIDGGWVDLVTPLLYPLASPQSPLSSPPPDHYRPVCCSFKASCPHAAQGSGSCIGVRGQGSRWKTLESNPSPAFGCYNSNFIFSSWAVAYVQYDMFI
jgi:hypothetical protein